jgi:hypothetical protein
MATMLIPRKDAEPAIVAGRIAVIKIGNKKIRFMMHDGHLSHFESGFRFGSLNDAKIRAMCTWGHNHKLNDRQAAEHLVQRIVAEKGADFVLAAIAEAPVLNKTKEKLK